MTGIIRSGSDNLIKIDTAIYSLTAIKKAAYKFADRASLILSNEPNNMVVVAFDFKKGTDQDKCIFDFCNEILDQDLREIVSRETAPIRNIILAHAFSRTSLIDKTIPS